MQVLSKNQAHEVVVPWQHETVTEEQCFEGHKMEAVDIEGGRDTGEFSFSLTQYFLGEGLGSQR